LSLPYLQPYFGLSNSLQTAQAAGGAGAVGGWVELGRTTLGSDNTLLTVASLPDKRYYMILGDHSQAGSSIRLNGDTGTSYAVRRNPNGTGDSTNANRSSGGFITDSRSTPHFNVTYLSNLSSKEKLWQNQNVYQSTAGAGTAPLREEGVGKWANTSNAVDEFAYLAWASTYQTGDEVVVLGWDPADTHTTNFWEELYSGSGTAGMDTGVAGFTAKKYLWVQAYLTNMTDAGQVGTVMNGDSGANYAMRRSANGGADQTLTSRTDAINYWSMGSSTEDEGFLNMFIINNSANEKLAIGHWNVVQTQGAGTAPDRQENVFKWSNTSAQITDLEILTSGTLGANSQLKIWGSD
jgi:hypothetical protein